jgi:putative DNA methylase
MTVPYRKKLIEVALPLPEINDASAYDKMPGIGPHPKGIHHWWARLPLPTARAILFASVVDDPSEHPDRFPTDEALKAERDRLFDVLRSMMEKKLHEKPQVYAAAYAEMLKHCDGTLPAVYDPFAGGGSIPLEANRLGFESHAADLNPVAVLLNKCNLELAPTWTGSPPVNPEDRKRIGGSDSWRGTHGLAADIRYYGSLVRDRAREKIGLLYPKVRLPKERGEAEAGVVAWIWARTVASPDPAAQGKHVPLVSTYWLSNKKENLAWLVPIVDKQNMKYHFEVHCGTPNGKDAIKAGTKAGRKGFRCLLTDSPMGFDYVREQFQQGKSGTQLVAVVAEIPRGKAYVAASPEQEAIALSAEPKGFPETDLPEYALGFRIQNYGIKHHWQMFTPRQLVAMVMLSDLVKQVGAEVERDAAVAGLAPAKAEDRGDIITTFLALAVDRCADFNNALCRWSSTNQKVMNLFGRQAIPMVWDYAEANILGESVGAWQTCSEYVADCAAVLNANSSKTGHARQLDAATGANGITNLMVSTDPPYYDNIGYAALSDFFYVWLRRTVGSLYPQLCSTLLVPKLPELIAAPERFDGDKEKAKEHFETGFRKAFTALRDKMDPRFPLTVYYAFKQDDEDSGADEDEQGTSSVDLTTGWETLLEALTSSGFQITGTWPVRASQAWRMRAMGSNALASYIVLACRPRPSNAPLATRKEIINRLRQDLPKALRDLQYGNIAPVDLAQAAIGPGMAIFTRHAKVIESDGTPMTVRTALGIINQVLDEVLAEQEGDFDPDTRWALAWFEQFGTNEGEYGVAETLSKAKNTAVNGLVAAGIVNAKSGKVQLVSRAGLSNEWNPAADKRLTVWEATQHLIRTLEVKGEGEAAVLLNKLGGFGETARELAYRLFSICEKKKWADEALAYNSLVIAWPELTKLAISSRNRQPTTQQDLFK